MSYPINKTVRFEEKIEKKSTEFKKIYVLKLKLNFKM